MTLRDAPRLYRRAVLIYAVTIVAPACVLLWLGLQSFERQREALRNLALEKLASEQERATLAAAENALAGHPEPIVKYRFTMEHGIVTHPLLTAPPRDAVPAELAEAQHQELDLNRCDLAVESYRRIRGSLALSGVARCLGRLGRTDEARQEWRTLAAKYPDERDLSHRPFGIIGAMQAGDTAGLFEQIASGRWDLSADQAEYFLAELAPARSSPYLDQFRFAREMNEQFHPAAGAKQGETQSYKFGEYRVFYRDDGGDRISGFAADGDWVNHTLRPQLERALGFENIGKRDLRVYGGAMAAVLLVLSAGVFLLFRDVAREARTNRLRSDFVSSVSHELKTPITLIRLYGDTLLDRENLSAEERRDFYRIVVRESERLSRLVNQILTFSRIERGAQVYNLEEGDLGAAIGSIVDDYREYLDRAGFRMERSLAASTPPVRIDATAVTQAVINLLDNAVKYSGASREIGVRLEACGGNVTFEVEDHGVGIPAAEQARIFERFYRVSNGSGKGGYGLGLFLVRHIMEAHGGRAEVNSDPGRGSRFRLVFPAVTQS